MTAPEAGSSNHMTFWEHLQELRVRLVRCALIVAVGFGATYWQRFLLWDWVQRPFLQIYKAQLIAAHRPVPEVLEPWAFTSLTEPFFSLMRISLWAAGFLTAPFLFYQVWAFIRPGLYEKERRLAIPFVVITSLCFLGGAAFAYFNAFRFLSDILLKEAIQAGLRSNLHLEDYLDLFIYTLVGTGLMFELPVLVHFLARFRILTARAMLRYWRHASMGIVFAAAFLTPGDVIVTTIFFSVVMLGLYFISVLVAWAAEPKAS